MPNDIPILPTWMQLWCKCICWGKPISAAWCHHIIYNMSAILKSVFVKPPSWIVVELYLKQIPLLLNWHLGVYVISLHWQPCTVDQIRLSFQKSTCHQRCPGYRWACWITSLQAISERKQCVGSIGKKTSVKIDHAMQGTPACLWLLQSWKRGKYISPDR